MQARAVSCRCVPHRYSYEFRAGWKPFAAAWGIGPGDTIVLERRSTDRSSLHIKVTVPAMHNWRIHLVR